MSDKAPKWYCTGTGPMIFSLGTRLGRIVQDVKATVIRQDNGSWNWHAFIMTGNEPSRLTAMYRAEIALKDQESEGAV